MTMEIYRGMGNPPRFSNPIGLMTSVFYRHIGCAEGFAPRLFVFVKFQTCLQLPGVFHSRRIGKVERVLRNR